MSGFSFFTVLRILPALINQAGARHIGAVVKP
jgi:hypothetical protein